VLRAALSAIALLMSAPVAAQAATLTVDAGVATYTGGAEPDRLQVRYDGAAATIAFVEPLLAATAPPATCTRTVSPVDATITCPAAQVHTLVLRTGAGADELLVANAGSTTAPVTLQAALGPDDDQFSAVGAAWPVRVESGDGRDTVVGGSLNDLLAGGAGVDVLDGGLGGDVLEGGAGDDRVTYRSRTARVYATLGGETTPIDGELNESDTIAADVEGVLGGSGDDLLVGTSARNFLDGGAGSDVLRGLAGDDVLLGDGPTDPATGIALDPAAVGDDVLESGRGADAMEGGGGVDTVSYLERLDRVRVDLGSRAAVQGQSRERDTVTGVENVWGGLGHDTLLGDGNANVLWGGPGRDVVIGRGGADVVAGGPGRDTLRGEAGDDVIAARDGAADVIACGAGADRVATDDERKDAVQRDCETSDPFAGGGVGGAPAGSMVNFEAVVDPNRPYALVAAERVAPATDGTLPVPLVCSARAAARCTGTIVLRTGGRVVGTADVFVAAGRDATIPVPLDQTVLARAQSGRVRLVATVSVRDVLGREAVTRLPIVATASP
jgi:Ca2+-binding RTX toxin-like protein